MSDALHPSQVEEEFTRALGVLSLDADRYPNLLAAINLSATRVERAREVLKNELGEPDPPIDVVAFGSMARFEMTPASDFDYLVIAYGLDVQPGAYRRTLTIADNLRATIGEANDIRKPGTSGLFGIMVSAPDLVDVIGLERDTNHSHSRRVLLLEESVSLYDPAKHARLIEAIIGRYLEARPPSASGMPRFLLNDLARYWRTLSIDYQAKTPPPARYSLRYLKLLISRKFTYASALAPLMTVVLAEHPDLHTSLCDAYSRPPILRMLDLGAVLHSKGDTSAVRAIAQTLDVTDEFNGLLGQQEWRDRVKRECTETNDPRAPTEFARARKLARQLQTHLEEVFFSETLAPIARKYLTF
ncbi:DUF294 nucleotidyltransferase-like domain-containing protein [Promicromonospora sp. NPDC050249]|uniref:DUF294 nucleotidyltransferase-like domain-containing protein n=1 Tax=Promicromonospora sp. NPDC050249 TaxID=3154743 RepID=UPI0033FE2B4A